MLSRPGSYLSPAHITRRTASLEKFRKFLILRAQLTRRALMIMITSLEDMVSQVYRPWALGGRGAEALLPLPVPPPEPCPASVTFAPSSSPPHGSSSPPRRPSLRRVGGQTRTWTPSRPTSAHGIHITTSRTGYRTLPTLLSGSLRLACSLLAFHGTVGSSHKYCTRALIWLHSAGGRPYLQSQSATSS